MKFSQARINFNHEYANKSFLTKSFCTVDGIFLGLYLNWLRSNDVLMKLSVGANGGSFAVGYWDNILIPKVDECFMDRLVPLYNNESELNPAIFNLDLLHEAGIYQLNSFLIKCKALLSQLCNDIKNDDLRDHDFYLHMTE